MHQSDWVGAPTVTPPQFRYIRNQRPSVAEQKATKLLQLGALLKRVPAKVRGGSVQCVRQWRAQHAKATKVAGNPRSSVTEIESAINAMELCGE